MNDVRIEKGLDVDDVARLAGISYFQAYRTLRGETKKPRIVKRIKDALKMGKGVAMKLVSLLLAVLFVAACGGQTTARVSLAPAPNECQITESRTVLSTTTVSVCWDGKTQALGMAGGSGMPSAAVPLALIDSAAKGGGTIFLGGAIKSGLKSIESITPTE